MFKALLAASVAMLACCAAAALAGPVTPVSDANESPAAERPSGPDALSVVFPVSVESQPPWVASPVDAVGFVPTVSLGSAPTGFPVSPAIAADPAPQPAVIPLPVPLYATILLLALALTARRMILRAC